MDTTLSGESKTTPPAPCTFIPHMPTPLTLCRAHLAVGFAVCRSLMGMREKREESEREGSPFPLSHPLACPPASSPSLALTMVDEGSWA